MNTYKLLVIISFIFISCSVHSNKAVSDVDTNTNTLDESEIARHNRLDSLHKVTVAKELEVQKITTPPRTVRKKVDGINGQN